MLTPTIQTLCACILNSTGETKIIDLGREFTGSDANRLLLFKIFCHTTLVTDKEQRLTHHWTFIILCILSLKRQTLLQLVSYDIYLGLNTTEQSVILFQSKYAQDLATCLARLDSCQTNFKRNQTCYIASVYIIYQIYPGKFILGGEKTQYSCNTINETEV